MDLKNLKGKNIHVILKNNWEYNGIVDEVNDSGNGLIFISMFDKFEKFIMFTSGEIKLLEVKGEKKDE